MTDRTSQDRINRPLLVASSDNPSTSKNKKNSLAKHRRKISVDAIKVGCTVAPKALKRYTNRAALPKTTTQADNPVLGLGQKRALNAFDTAFDIHATGYHVFAVGENGLGKRTLIQNYLTEYYIKTSSTSSLNDTSSTSESLSSKINNAITDWIYLYNYDNPRTPLAFELPSGLASLLAKDLKEIWAGLNQSLLQLLQKTTQPNDKKTDLASPCIADSNAYKNTARHYLAPLFDSLLTQYELNPRLHKHLLTMQADMIEQAYYIALSSTQLNQTQTALHSSLPFDRQVMNSRFYTDNFSVLPARYSITILSEKLPKDLNRPCLFEGLPTPSRLFGNIEHTMCHGTYVSDITMIRAGALHRANGGYLLLEAADLMDYPEAWQGLKHALKTNQVDLATLTNFQKPNASQNLMSLAPQPIPLNIKIILLGDEATYDAFVEHDAEFMALFKIRADFHEDIERNLATELAMVAKMEDIITKHQMAPFNANAQALVLEDLSLQAENQNRLSLHTDRLTQLMLEADRHARQDVINLQKDATSAVTIIVEAKHVKQALYDIDYRSGYLRELYGQELTDGQQLIRTTGAGIGQINALTIIDYADSEFGMPARLTAVVQHSMGSGDILDIERDVELGGSLHAKGMLIMNSYLRALFSPYHPLNFTASLAFEQSYAHIDGDSATLAEACALLSALAETPISQALAITGSMNQLGMVQAVGGINAKIVGFFDTCQQQGLSGHQGVILPCANIPQLMLRDDIIEAVSNKQFHIYGVNTLSEALTILADMPVDNVNSKGHYRKSSLFGRIIKNLEKWEDQLNPVEDNENAADNSNTSSNKTLGKNKGRSDKHGA